LRSCLIAYSVSKTEILCLIDFLFNDSGLTSGLSIKHRRKTMDFGLGILTFGTLAAVQMFALYSARETERVRREGRVRSTLAADTPNTRAAMRSAD
jgi:hypothetical protein